MKSTDAYFRVACLEIESDPRWTDLAGSFKEDLAQVFGEECVSPESYREERIHAEGISESTSFWGGPFFSESAPITKLRAEYAPDTTPGSYRLEANASGISLFAGCDEGMRSAMASLMQLLLKEWDGWRFRLPECSIRDTPQYGWRGVMIDSARHFIPVPELKKIIRTLSFYKLNRLQWHLTDDQGWRIQIRSHPELISSGSRRPGGDPNKDGFYSQDEIRDLVDFALKHGIQIMPEIDLPGHALSLLACRPDLSCSGGPHSVWMSWGISDEVLCMGNPDVLPLVKEIWNEVCSLFPAPWVHIGGDECPTTRWKTCPRCQSLKTELGLENDVDLHGWFIRELSGHIRSRGKEVFGWDEVLDSTSDNGVNVYHWRQWKPELGNEALCRGRALIRSPAFPYYLDYVQKEDRRSTCGIAHEVSYAADMETVYRFDPEEGLDRENLEKGKFLGIQANLWTEFIRDGKRLEYMLFPRVLAVAETAWSGRERPVWSDFSAKIDEQRRMLSILGINACPKD